MPKKSIEKLTHFICQKCSKWWSIGDAPTCNNGWYCPWCGDWSRDKEYTKAELKKKNPLMVAEENVLKCAFEYVGTGEKVSTFKRFRAVIEKYVDEVCKECK